MQQNASKTGGLQAKPGQSGRPQPNASHAGRPQPSRPDPAVRYPEMEDEDDFEFMDLDD